MEMSGAESDKSSISATIDVVQTVPFKIRMHTIEDHQLDVLVNASRPIMLSLFGFCAGTLISLLPSVRDSYDIMSTAEFGGDDLFFMILDALAFVGSMCFGYLALKGEADARNLAEEIRGRDERPFF